MARALSGFARRRQRNLALSAGLAGLFLLLYLAYRASLHRPEFLTGWTLLALVLMLSLLNLRSRLSMLPLGAAASWLQWHVYAGVLAVFVFALHSGLRWPSGLLDGALAAVFIIASLSGLVGLYLSRRLPRRLTRRGEEVIFERIPGFIAGLREAAETVVREAAAHTGSTTLAQHYEGELSDFFAAPRHAISHVLGSGRPTFMLLYRLDAVERYLGEDEREFHRQLREIVEKKDELDFMYALQFLLKIWLLVHVPAVGALLVLMLIHVLLAYAFTGPL